MKEERKRTGAALPYMAPEEKARRYALGLELTGLKERLAEEVQQLTALPWATPGDIPLLELEEIIQVKAPTCARIRHQYSMPAVDYT